jgi:hypothetical protein
LAVEFAKCETVALPYVCAEMYTFEYDNGATYCRVAITDGVAGLVGVVCAAMYCILTVVLGVDQAISI